MPGVLLAPPIAFLSYLLLVGLLSGMGRILAGPGEDTELKSSLYGSGEAAPESLALPGYRPFFRIALFFAILHLGVLTLGSSELAPIGAIYLVGLALALLVLVLG